MKDYKGRMIKDDVVEVIGQGSLIQHGKHNDSVYLLKLDERDSALILQEIKKLVRECRYSKVSCKVPACFAPLFFADGYFLEASIPNFYNSKDDVFFVSKFLHSDRLMNIETEALSALSDLLKNKQVKKNPKTSCYTLRKLNATDVDKIVDIYREVFETYPFPIHKPSYILQTMQEDVQYYGVEKGGRLLALSSAKVDVKGQNAEMMHFATPPQYGGHNFSSMLLDEMEKEMHEQGIYTLYTIARLTSIPMNLTFLRNDFHYSGTLIKNANIAGKVESMNVLYKHLRNK